MKLWRNILLPHHKLANMFSNVMSDRITLTSNMVKINSSKGLGKGLSFSNYVTISSKRGSIILQSIDNYL